MALLFLLILGIVVWWVIDAALRSQREKTLAAEQEERASLVAAQSFRLREYLRAYVAPEMTCSHMEMAADFSGAVIVDAATRRFCLADVSGINWRPSHQIYEAADLIGVRLVEDGNTVHESRTDANEVVGRALVGDLLAGSTGALIGGMTASRQSRSVRIVSRLELQLTLNDLARPLWRLPLLPQPAPTDSTLYAQARTRAQHWEALFRAVKQSASQRNPSRGALPALHRAERKTLTPGHLADLQTLGEMVNDRDVLDACGYQRIPDSDLPALLAYLNDQLPAWREQTSFELGDYLTQTLCQKAVT